MSYAQARELAWHAHDARWRQRRNRQMRQSGRLPDDALLNWNGPATMVHADSLRYKAGYDAGYANGITARRQQRQRALVTALVIALAVRQALRR